MLNEDVRPDENRTSEDENLAKNTSLRKTTWLKIVIQRYRTPYLFFHGGTGSHQALTLTPVLVCGFDSLSTNSLLL